MLKLARETEPDLIICDFDMPEMDGGEVSAALLADEELRLHPAAVPHRASPPRAT